MPLRGDGTSCELKKHILAGSNLVLKATSCVVGSMNRILRGFASASNRARTDIEELPGFFIVLALNSISDVRVACNLQLCEISSSISRFNDRLIPHLVILNDEHGLGCHSRLCFGVRRP